MPLPGIYTPDVPQGPQQINNTQSPININYQDIYALLDVNHVAFNVDGFGKHKFVSYLQQSSDPDTAASEMALYSKPVAGDPNILELFYRYPSNGEVFQLTPFMTSTTSQPVANNTSGGTFTIDNTILPNSGFGYVLGGYWQYLTNNTLLICGTVGNYYYPTTITSPYT